MTKKLIALVLALVFCLALTACGGSNNNAEPTAEPETEAEATEAPETEAEATEVPETDAAETEGEDAAETEGEDAAETEGEDAAEADGEPVVLKVGASSTPHAVILEQVVDVLAEQGIDLQITEYGDYVVPNTAVEEGEDDANYFQHIPYLDEFNATRGTHLVSVAGIHIEPMGIYAGKTASLEELAEGATVAVPNDVTNEARALLLLQSQGLITLKEGAGLEATPNDIEENELDLQFKEVEAAMVPNIVSEVDIAVINSNYAMEAGFNPVEDSLAIEDADSPYVNVLVVKEGNEDDPAIQALVEALQSDAVREFIETKYEGAVVPVF